MTAQFTGTNLDEREASRPGWIQCLGRLVVPAVENQELIDYVRQAAESAEIVGSFGTGSLVLGAAGLLAGKKATTHWAYAGELEQWGAGYVHEPWVEDGRIITGAGAAAAVDMSLLLLSRLRSQKAAKQVQIMAEWDPHPPFGGINWSGVNGNAGLPAAPCCCRPCRDHRPGHVPGV